MRKRFGCIYKITNKLNGKVYVGRTIRDPKVRFREHCRPKKSKWNRSLINSSIQLHGEDNFTFEILETNVPESEIDIREEGYINKFDCMAPKGYNCIERYAGSMISEVTRQKISEAGKGRTPWNLGAKGKQKAWNKGIYNQGACKPITATHMITGETKEYVSAAEAVREGFNSGHVTQCCKGKLKHHKGYYWSYNKGNADGEES